MNIYYNINKYLWAQIEFNKRHHRCPACKNPFSGTTTLTAFHPNPKDEDEIYRYYYDNNYLTCVCGNGCRRTELLPEPQENKSIKLSSPIVGDGWGMIMNNEVNKVNKVKCEIGDQTFFLSPEEYEDLLVSLYKKGYYISKFDMKFYEQDSAGEFTEEVKMVGNPKFPEYNGRSN